LDGKSQVSCIHHVVVVDLLYGRLRNSTILFLTVLLYDVFCFSSYLFLFFDLPYPEPILLLNNIIICF
jgi:hypothetical protein